MSFTVRRLYRGGAEDRLAIRRPPIDYMIAHQS